jgi:proteasome lid subunit RPN8/RPN11
MSLENTEQIVLSEAKWQELLAHCNRKLTENYLPDETKYPRAYGLIAGTLTERVLKIEKIFPVKRNVRRIEPFKSYMDKILLEHAVPSKTPLSERAWMTDPVELKEIYDICDKEGLMVIGTYHSHIVAWSHDPIRDTPTKLDTLLAKHSNLYQFIISLIDVKHPIIRAFYEGFKEKEVAITIR